jgi:hypothetical protein
MTIYNEPIQPVSGGILIPQPLASPRNQKPMSAPNKNAPQMVGLVAWWSALYADTGKLYEIISGVTTTLTDSAAPLDPSFWDSDSTRGGNVLSLNGTSYATAQSTTNATNQTGDFTLSAWIKTSTNGPIMVKKATIFAASDSGYAMSVSAGVLSFILSDGTTQMTATGTISVTDGQWHLVTARYSRNGGFLELFVDGIYDGGTASSLVSSGFTNSSSLLIGKDDTTFFTGKVDDIRIYKRSLTNYEIKELWNPQTRWSLWQTPAMFTVALTFTGAGGLVAAGSGTTTESYNPLIAAAGVLAAGTATTTVRYTPSITANGVLCDGSGTITANYNPTITANGVLAAGAANNTEVDNFVVVAAGVLAAGSGTTTANYSPDITANGVLCDGSGTITANYNPTITANGVLCDGSGDGYATFIPPITANGVLIDGSGSAYCVYSPSLTADGVWGNGSGVGSANVYNNTMSGGAYGDGSGTTTANYSPDITANGVLGAGSGDTSQVQNQLIVANGVLGAGSGETTANYSPDITANGVLVGGSASVTESDEFQTSGGALAGGTALVQANYNTTPVGGSYVSGSGSASQQFNPLVSGGSYGAGSSGIYAIYNVSITASGLSASGSGVGGGSIYTISPSGGTLAGGSASVTTTFSPQIAAYGSLLASSALDTEIHNVSLTSAGSVAGSSGVVGIQPPVSGGSLTDGSAIFNAVFLNTTQSGVVVGGIASVTSNEIRQVSGGAVAGGSSSIQQTVYHYESEGGNVTVGSATRTRSLGFHTNYLASGEAQTGGSARSVYGFVWAAKGSVVIEGSVGVDRASYIYIPRTSRGNRVIVGSTALYSTVAKAHGGAIMGGSAEINRNYMSCIAEGDITMASGNLYTRGFMMSGKGKAAISGSGHCKISHRSVEMNGKITVFSDSVCIMNKTPFVCNEDLCVILVKNQHDCPSLDFYYDKLKTAKPDRTRGGGAYLPAITKCRQRVPTDRRRRVPEQK